MVTKSKATAKSHEGQLADAMRDAVLQIWHAGLGAFAKAQEEGGEVFAKLARDGAELQNRTRTLAHSGASEVADSVTKIADNVSKQAAGSWSRLEKRLEDGVARALHRVGVPVRNDLDALVKRIEDLSKSIEGFTATKSAASRSAAASNRKAAKAVPAKRVAHAARKTAPRATAKAGAKRVEKSAPSRV